jgi:O-acetyl-ADP-ribose deacetylase
LNSLQLAVDHNCKTIAFPNISTGIYRFPKEEAAKISIDSIQNFLSRNTFIEKVIIVCFDDENFRHVLNRVRNVQESDTTDA